MTKNTEGVWAKRGEKTRFFRKQVWDAMPEGSYGWNPIPKPPQAVVLEDNPVEIEPSVIESAEPVENEPVQNEEIKVDSMTISTGKSSPDLESKSTDYTATKKDELKQVVSGLSNTESIEAFFDGDNREFANKIKRDALSKLSSDE